ncbi:M18 family aminopeptidase [Schaalia sp. lx-100]|uniref:M18 family aminopeptidase n=1 Tax=Schaalia sp. lx-100 TaxID=2899081 RepID=UPI001E5AED6E|nr:M18 family aminopeptidase [Schaalia sp. lx-100]MCD4557486.1 M18 family aminopeptidase [Schaalia sp. lx-100]
MSPTESSAPHARASAAHFLSVTDQDVHTRDYISFLNDSPTSFHAAQLSAQRLIDAGFSQHNETDPWDASPGGHLIIRDGAVVAWFVPHRVSDDTHFRIVGAHTDSPCLTVKPSPTSRTVDGWEHINVEIYGGMLWNSWLDRELCVAGRVITTDGRCLIMRTGPLARIPQLAIHLDRAVNNDGLKLNPQKHIHPVWNVGSPAQLMDIVARDAGLEGAHMIAAYDLRLVPSQAAATFGADNVFVAAGRQDNLSSVHAGLRALERLSASGIPDSGDILVFACFDHEEIGSATRSGAAGPILRDVLSRTASAVGRDFDGAARMYAASTCISADAGHSVHPNYPEHHDPAHHPILGGGPMLKVNAQQRYATDGVGTALWNRACAQAGISSQVFVSNNAMPCGSTIGSITATQLGITTVDVGVPLLSMHSAREMSHVADLYALSLALEAYWAGA